MDFNLNWFPGHMAKARRLVKENLKLVDVVIEVLDARIPMSSRNPELKNLAAGKPRLVVLNKSDLADPDLTLRWKKYFLSEGNPAVAVDSVGGSGVREVSELVRQLAAPKMSSLMSSGRRSRSVRCMVLGIPNVGKSFFINKLVGQRAARAGDKPGITRGQQWVRVAGNLELLDTPGILKPGVERPEAAFRLIATGAIKEDLYDLHKAAVVLLKWLVKKYPQALKDRYRLEPLPHEPEIILEEIGSMRGYYQAGGIVDTLKAAQAVLKEFREGTLGRYTMDDPGDIKEFDAF